jgi:hypothetical protein
MEARVRVRSLKHCFVLIPSSWTALVRPSEALKLEWNQQDGYFGWNGLASYSPEDRDAPHIEIDAHFAALVGMDDGHMVRETFMC